MTIQFKFNFSQQDLSNLRKTARQSKLTQQEYANFLRAWYNQILEGQKPISQLHDFLKYLENPTNVSLAIPMEFLVAKNPSSNAIATYYILLYGFLSSFYPSGPSPNKVARVLTKVLQKRGVRVNLKNIPENNLDRTARATLTDKGLTFYLGIA